MTLKYLLATAALAASLVGAVAANAGTTVIGTESDSGGFVGNLLESAFPGTAYLVASDGESSFDPFGAGYDTTDGLNFSGVGFVWDQAPDSSWNSLGSQTWVLPANLSGIGCGVENATTCEPVGHFISPSSWSPGAIGTWVIMDSDGHTVSDVIKTFNGAGGAELLFYSDPSLPGGVPEPASWALMISGFGLAGAALRRRRAAIARLRLS
jgi:hypothetical protein